MIIILTIIYIYILTISIVFVVVGNISSTITPLAWRSSSSSSSSPIASTIM